MDLLSVAKMGWCLRREASALKECVADLTLENRLLKKSILADGENDA